MVESSKKIMVLTIFLLYSDYQKYKQESFFEAIRVIVVFTNIFTVLFKMKPQICPLFLKW
jgi:hypothetical protein